MTARSKSYWNALLVTGYHPTQSDYVDLIDSYIAATPGVNDYHTAILAEPSIVTYYKLDEAVSATTCADSTASANTLTVNGPVAFQVKGPFDSVNSRAVAFKGDATTYLINSSPANLPTGNAAFTVEMWVKIIQPTGGEQDVLEYGTEASGEDVIVSLNGGALNTIRLAAFGGGFNSDYIDQYDINSSSWHHLVMTYTSGNTQLYLDGVFIGTQTLTTINITIGAIRLGCPGFASTGLFGALACVAIYNAVLTSGDIASHYALGRAVHA